MKDPDPPYFINKFCNVCWKDPFPEEDPHKHGIVEEGLNMPQYWTDSAYPEQRFIEGLSPYCLYLPKKEIMFKMMRACIKVQDPKDLWFVQKDKEKS